MKKKKLFLFLFLFLLLLFLILLIEITIWKLVKTENYITFKNIGNFPLGIFESQGGRLKHPRKENLVEYNERMRYLRKEEEKQ